jgi:hypothetical protein
MKDFHLLSPIYIEQLHVDESYQNAIDRARGQHHQYVDLYKNIEYPIGHIDIKILRY